MTESASPQTPLPVVAEQVVAEQNVAPRPHRLVVNLAGPFGWAFVGAIAVLIVLALGVAFGSLSAILMSTGVALFVALALNPLVRRMEAKGASRRRAVGTVSTVFVAVVAALVWFVVPAVVGQVVAFAQAVPSYINDVTQSQWFQSFIATTGGSAFYESATSQVQAWLSNPSNLFALGAGVLGFGVGVINAISTTMIVVVLTLYFLSSLETMKNALYQLAPAYGRPKLAELTEQITNSVGSAIAGGITLSILNATFSLILLTLLHVPYAIMLAFLSLIITTIPMIGSVVFWVLASVVALLYSWPAGVAFVIIYFAYMQMEAYWLTPRIMGRAISVPGSLVLIGAMIGATLLGLLGALVAGPITASILLILRSVFIPRQNAKLYPEVPIGLETPLPVADAAT